MVRMAKGKRKKGLTFRNIPACPYGVGKIIHYGSYVHLVKTPPFLKYVTATSVAF